jgi:hypothetical protein
MDPVESICPSDKLVSLSKPRSRTNPDGALVVEVDAYLDNTVTLVFTRKDAPIAFCGAFRDVLRDDRVHRVPYVHELPEGVLSLARDRAIDACAEHDREPPTERRGKS